MRLRVATDTNMSLFWNCPNSTVISDEISVRIPDELLKWSLTELSNSCDSLGGFSFWITTKNYCKHNQSNSCTISCRILGKNFCYAIPEEICIGMIGCCSIYCCETLKPIWKNTWRLHLKKSLRKCLEEVQK